VYLFTTNAVVCTPELNPVHVLNVSTCAHSKVCVPRTRETSQTEHCHHVETPAEPRIFKVLPTNSQGLFPATKEENIKKIATQQCMRAHWQYRCLGRNSARTRWTFETLFMTSSSSVTGN